MNHTEYKDLPRIAIIGRPNVGKSSIFNRILKRRTAIVESTAGVTRDRLYAHIRLSQSQSANFANKRKRKKGKEVDFVLVDTGGIVPKPKEKMAHLVYTKSREAIEESSAVIFACDLLSGITYQDEHIAALLRSTGKKTFLVVNKIDNARLENDASEFYRLGLGKPYGLSALQNKGFSQLFGDIVGYISGLPRPSSYGEDTLMQEGPGNFIPSIKMAVVGRPNVGKSSFINCLINQEQLLVDEVPGTTRDSIDIQIKRDKELLTIVDTAGMRHKKKIREVVEIFSLARSKLSIRRCDVVLIMIDAMTGLSRDDIAVIDYVIKEGRSCLLLVNKQDLVKDLKIEDYKKSLRFRFNPLKWIPIIFTSSKEKKNIVKAIDRACEIAEKSRLFIPTPQINELLGKAQDIMAHPFCGKTRPRIYYGTQIEAAPPKFLLFVTEPKYIKNEYLKFLEDHFRRRFDLQGVPVVFELRRKRTE